MMNQWELNKTLRDYQITAEQKAEFPVYREGFIDAWSQAGLSRKELNAILPETIEELFSQHAEAFKTGSIASEYSGFLLNAFKGGGELLGKDKRNEIWHIRATGQLLKLRHNSGDYITVTDISQEYNTLYKVMVSESSPVEAKTPSAPVKEPSASNLFLNAVHEKIEGDTPEGLSIQLKPPNVTLRHQHSREVWQTFGLTPKISAASEAGTIIDRCIRTFNQELRDYHTQVQALKIEYGVVRTASGNNTAKFIVPQSPSESCTISDISTPAATQRLAQFKEKLDRIEMRRTERKEALISRGFTIEVAPGENGAQELVVSHPDPTMGWQTRRAEMTPVGKFSDAAAGLLTDAEKAAERKPEAQRAAPAPQVYREPPAGGHASRVKKVVMPLVTAGGIVRSVANIAPRQAPTIFSGEETGPAKPLNELPAPFTPAAIRGATPQQPPGQVDVLIDTSVLSILDMKRKDGKEWLDLIHVLKSLPSVNLVFPSYIIDFEFNGVVPHHISAGNSRLDPVDTFRARRNAENHKKYFSSSRRYAFNARQGSYALNNAEAVQDPYVWESSQQHAAYRQLEAALAGSVSGSDEYKAKLKQFRLDHENLGELFAYDYTQSSQCTNPVIIIADDRHFADRFYHNHPEPLHNKTSAGKGITVCDSKTLVDALNQAFHGRLAEELRNYSGHQREAASAIDTSFRSIIDASNKAHREDRHCDHLFECHRGVDEDGRPEKTLQQVIADGIARRGARHASKASGPGAHSQHLHAARASLASQEQRDFPSL